MGARGPDWSRAWAVSCGSRAYYTPGMRLSSYRILPEVEALDRVHLHNIPEDLYMISS